MNKLVKDPNIYIPPLQGNTDSSSFTIQSGVLTSISSRRCSTISGCPLNERIDIGPTVAARQIHLLYAPGNQTTAFIPHCSPTHRLTNLVASITRY